MAAAPCGGSRTSSKTSGRGRKKPDVEVTREELFEQIGRLKIEVDWLKKNLPNSIEAKRRMMESASGELTISRQCELLNFPRSTYYFHPRGESEEYLKLMLAIDRYHTEHVAFGSRQIAKDFGIGRDRAKRLMRIIGIEAVYPKPQTTHPDQGHENYPYFLQDLEISGQSENVFRGQRKRPAPVGNCSAICPSRLATQITFGPRILPTYRWSMDSFT